MTEVDDGSHVSWEVIPVLGCFEQERLVECFGAGFHGVDGIRVTITGNSMSACDRCSFVIRGMLEFMI